MARYSMATVSSTSDPARRLAAIRSQIAAAAIQAERPSDSITLVAVSKTQPAAAIAALADLGQRDFGENYLQEALGKMQELADLPIEWHFIGPIQSNKTRPIANKCITAIDIAMKELRGLRQLVINFKHGGYTKKNKEAEIDHGVHETRC